MRHLEHTRWCVVVEYFSDVCEVFGNTICVLEYVTCWMASRSGQCWCPAVDWHFAETMSTCYCTRFPDDIIPERILQEENVTSLTTPLGVCDGFGLFETSSITTSHSWLSLGHFHRNHIMGTMVPTAHPSPSVNFRQDSVCHTNER